MPTLTLIPTRASYSSGFGDSVLRVELDGGMSKQRRDQLGSSRVVGVRWVLSAIEYEYLLAFWRQLGDGTDKFTVSLVIDDSSLTEYVAQFVPGSLKLAEPSPDAFVVTASLEVEPHQADPDVDAGLVLLFGLYGSDYPALLAALEQFANYDAQVTP